MLQTVMNIQQAFGKSGTYADDSARRDAVYAIYGGETAGAVARGSIKFTNNLTAADTITIGETTLTAVVSSAGEDEFVVGDDLAATLANIAALTVDDVVLSANGTTLFVTADVAGADGNEIALETSITSGVTVTAMAGGADGEATMPVLARFYTLKREGKAVMGGTGLQLGVAMNNGNVALVGGLEPSLAVNNGTPVDICSFGHIFIESATAITIGYGACYDNVTGIISAYNTAGAVPAGNTAITGATFIRVSGTANTVGILSLNGK